MALLTNTNKVEYDDYGMVLGEGYGINLTVVNSYHEEIDRVTQVISPSSSQDDIEATMKEFINDNYNVLTIERVQGSPDLMFTVSNPGEGDDEEEVKQWRGR